MVWEGSAHEPVFSAGLAARLIGSTFLPYRTRGDLLTLIEREREMLHLKAQRASTQQIAKLSSLSAKTVRNYVSDIFTKVQVADHAQAIIRAREAGLGRDA